jgi:hypothetical protein
MTGAEERFGHFVRDAQRVAADSDPFRRIAMQMAAAFSCVAASFLLGYVFRQMLGPLERHSTITSFAAVAAAGYITERLIGSAGSAYWFAAGGCILINGIRLMGYGDPTLPWESLIWFAKYAAILVIVTGSLSRRGKPHSPNQSVCQRKGFRIVRHRPTFFLTFREYVVK